MLPAPRPLVLYVTPSAQDFALGCKRLSARWRLMWGDPVSEAVERLERQQLRPAAVVISLGPSVTPELPVVAELVAWARPAAVVALAREDDRAALLFAGASDVLPKPVSYQRLDAWLSFAAARAPRASAAAGPGLRRLGGPQNPSPVPKPSS
jgi:DNA-binding response OmpR family regulator